MTHRYPRTERDLRALAVNFSAGNITHGIAERLECLAAWHRTIVEAEKAHVGQPSAYAAAQHAYTLSIDRMRAAGVGVSEDEFAFSPCMGPDAS